MQDPVAALIDELAEEKRRLDRSLDEMLERFAEYEEGLNARFKLAREDELPALMAERARMEETLGIADLVERIDRVRERIAMLKGQAEADRAA